MIVPIEERRRVTVSSIKPRLRYRDGGVLFRMMATGISSGLPLTSALQLLTSQQMTPAQKRLTRDIINSVDQGGYVSDGFRGWESVLPSVVPALVRLGEETGRLDKAFQWISEIYEFLNLMSRKFVSALLYPAFVLTIGLLLLPLPRLIINGYSAYLSAMKPPLLGVAAIALLIYVFRKLNMNRSALGVWFSRLILTMPKLGTITRNISSARFAKVLSVSLASGMDMSSALKISGDACGNQFMRGRIYAMIPRIMSDGSSLTGELVRSGVFSNMFCNLVSAGEQAGDLDSILLKAEEILKEDAVTSIQRISVLIGPVVFIIVAIFLGMQIVSLWGNYFSQVEGIANQLH
jgi:type IV pilus assembly protein PilC